MNQRRVYELRVNLPFLTKGTLFVFYDASANVHWIEDNGKETEYPLRPGLSGYLWLLLTEKKYMKLIEANFED